MIYRIVSREEAIKCGSVRYFNGRACRNGHIAERYTLSGFCCVCQLIATKRQKQAAKEIREGAKRITNRGGKDA